MKSLLLYIKISTIVTQSVVQVLDDYISCVWLGFGWHDMLVAAVIGFDLDVNEEAGRRKSWTVCSQ